MRQEPRRSYWRAGGAMSWSASWHRYAGGAFGHQHEPELESSRRSMICVGFAISAGGLPDGRAVHAGCRRAAELGADPVPDLIENFPQVVVHLWG